MDDFDKEFENLQNAMQGIDNFATNAAGVYKALRKEGIAQEVAALIVGVWMAYMLKVPMDEPEGGWGQ